eukprot:538467-Ditylum_brightwellii.AAC.1
MRRPAVEHHLEDIGQLESNLLEIYNTDWTEDEKSWVLNDTYSGIPLPKVKTKTEEQHMIPVTLLLAKAIQRCESRWLMK